MVKNAQSETPQDPEQAEQDLQGPLPEETGSKAQSPTLPADDGGSFDEEVVEDEQIDVQEHEEDEEDEDYDQDDEELDLDEQEYHTKLKPQLGPSTSQALLLRRHQQSKRPAFKRQEWHRYQRLGVKWRRPKGLHSKQRRGMRYRSPTAKVGYGSHAEVRGLHPSGFQEVLVHNPDQLEGLDPGHQAVRIASPVGLRKRELIQKEAERLKLRVLNPTSRRLRYRQLVLALSRGEQ